MNKLNGSGLLALLGPLLGGVIIAVIYQLASAKVFGFSLIIYLSVFSFVGVMGNVWIASKNPDLMNRRGEIKEDAQTWDKLMMALFMLGFLVLVPLVAGLESRTHGLVLSMESFYLGLLVFLISALMAIKAMLGNPYFENFVRRQTEYNHRAVDTGLYRIMRHPAYAALILTTLSEPILLRSRSAFWVSLILVGLIIIRTYKEDEFLSKNMPGYQAYREKVKDRLIPFIW